MPLPDGEAALTPRDGGKEFSETSAAIRGEFESHGDAVEDPTQDVFLSFPIGIALAKFLDRGRLASGRRVVGVERTEDLIDGVQERASHVKPAFRVALDQTKIIVNVDVVLGKAVTAAL
jgi:hypothetical protein